MRTLTLLPSIMKRVDDALLVRELNAMYFNNEINETTLHAAITAPSASVEVDYERLELLGMSADNGIKYNAEISPRGRLFKISILDISIRYKPYPTRGYSTYRKAKDHQQQGPSCECRQVRVATIYPIQAIHAKVMDATRLLDCETRVKGFGSKQGFWQGRLCGNKGRITR